MRGQFWERGQAVLLATTVIGGMAFSPVATGQALAQARDQRIRVFNIPAKPIRQAMNDIVGVTGINVVFPETPAASNLGKPVAGTMTASQAIDVLLAGSGLSYSFTNANTVTITARRQPEGEVAAQGPNTLRPIILQGEPATTEGSNSYGSEYTTIGKDGASIRETPQSVSVVTRKRLDDQNLTTLDQAIANTTGTVVQQGDSDRPNYYARGFPIDNIQLDGVPTNVSITAAAPDLAMYDRVEVLRGPAGLLGGMGSPGGTFNLVRKMPLQEFHVSNTLTGGSYDYIRNQFDITGPFNDALRGRLVGTLQSQEFIEDDTYRRLGQIYGVFEADVTDKTKLRIGGYYQRSPARQAWSGVPANSNYELVDAPRSTYFGAPWNHNIYTQSGAFAEVEHEFDNDWSTKATVNYLRYQSDVTASNFLGQINPVTLTGTYSASKWDQDDQQIGIDWYATGPVSLFDREHKLNFGINASHQDRAQHNYYGPLADRFYLQTRSIFDLDFPEPAFDGPIYGRHTITDQFSAYANARISLADPLTLVLGGRLLWWDSDFKPNPDQNFLNAARTHDRINAEPIPFAGVVYDLNDMFSVYGSYAKIFQPQTTRNAAGDLLDPVQGEQYEVGVKGSFLDGRLNATMALFNLKQKNRALLDTSIPGGTTYNAAGEAMAQGVELEVSGQLTDNWNLFAGYTYTDTRNYDESANTNGAAFSTIAPRHLFRLWSTYNLPGELENWTIGGGVFASSSFYSQDAGGRLKADGYATVSANVSFKFNEHFTASLNVDNVFDKEYIRSLNGTTNGYYGTPRTFMLKLQSTW